MHYFVFPSWLKPEIVPGLPFRWYALMYVVAFFITYALFIRQSDRTAISSDRESVSGFFVSGFAGLLIGARVFYCLVYDTSGIYLHKPWLMFWPFSPSLSFTGLSGMSYHGGVLGAAAAAVIYGLWKKIDLLQWGDMLLAALPLGYMFGRIGNFINGELYGRVTAAWWGVLFPNAGNLPVHEPWVRKLMSGFGLQETGGMVNLPRHPSQLYEAFGEGLLLWLILWFIVRKRKKFKGEVISAYLIGYGIIRFIIEYFRTPDRGMGFPIMFSPVTTSSHLVISPVNFTTGQILCAGMILAGTACWFLFRYMNANPDVMRRRNRLPAGNGRDTD